MIPGLSRFGMIGDGGDLQTFKKIKVLGGVAFGRAQIILSSISVLLTNRIATGF